MAKVKIKNFGVLQTKISRMDKEIQEGADEATKRIARVLGDDIREDAPVDTGALRSSVESTDNAVNIGNTRVDYAGFIEDREAFIEPNIRGVENRAAKIVEEEVGRRLT